MRLPTFTQKHVGNTKYGDPEIVLTVDEGHPKAGFQLILRGTALMPPPCKGNYLIHQYPESAPMRGQWYGGTRSTTWDEVLREMATFVNWLHWRETVREAIEVGALRHHIDRVYDGLWEYLTIDVEQEWQALLAEVSRVNLIMEEYREGS